MALINRVARIFRADFNAVLDQIEEPDVLLKQSIRDMEDDLLLREQRILDAGKECEILQARCDETQNELDAFAEQIDLCFAEGKEQLVRQVLRKKLEAERLLKKLAAKCDAQARLLADERKVHDENVETLESLRQKAELATARHSRQEAKSAYSDIARMQRELQVGEEDVEIAFLREKATRGVA